MRPPLLTSQEPPLRQSPRSTSSFKRAPHQVRLIGGQWKRTPVNVLEIAGLRPTPDRVRETVFNWLQHWLAGVWDQVNCLDLFAGSGALGFEAASRGAANVLFVETALPAIKQLEQLKTKLHAEQVRIQRGDAPTVARHLAISGARFNLIFLDPPYRQEWLATMLPLCLPLVPEDGLVYVEAEMPLATNSAPAWLAGWKVVRADRAGLVFYHLLQRHCPSEFQA